MDRGWIDQHRACSVIHETSVAIDAMTEIVEQMAQATRKPPVDIWQGDGVLVGATRSFDISALGRAR